VRCPIGPLYLLRGASLAYPGADDHDWQKRYCCCEARLALALATADW
jgi:hypothetical protein